MTRTVVLAVLLCMFTGSLHAVTLDDVIKDKELFSQSKAQFLAKYGKALGFRWVSADKTSVRSAAKTLAVFGLTVPETIVHFKDEKVKSVYISVYNRGDEEDLEREVFEGTVLRVASSIDKLTGVKPEIRNSSGAIKKRRHQWVTRSKKIYTLEYSGGKTRDRTGNKIYRAEYIRFTLAKVAVQKGRAPVRIARTKGITSRNISELKKSIVKGKNGDVYLDGVPMVDQGQKGYCACATTARILGYFGRTIDQHEIAQIANTDALGTSPTALMEALKDVRTRLRISIKEEMVFDFGEFGRDVREYNKLAKKSGQPTRNPGNPINLNTFFTGLNSELWVKARTRRSSDLRKFLQTKVKRTIDDGLPLAWSVMLGIVKEPEIPQASGGHMRMIIGYNLKTNEIMYSDSWGRGHEMKRMKASNALGITTGLYVIRPR